MDREKVEREVECFRLEYPDYTSEHVSDYLQLLDDFTDKEKDLFCELLGF